MYRAAARFATLPTMRHGAMGKEARSVAKRRTGSRMRTMAHVSRTRACAPRTDACRGAHWGGGRGGGVPCIAHARYVGRGAPRNAAAPSGRFILMTGSLFILMTSH